MTLRLESSRLQTVPYLSSLSKSDSNYPLEWRIYTKEDEYLAPRFALLLQVHTTHADGTDLVYDSRMVIFNLLFDLAIIVSQEHVTTSIFATFYIHSHKL